MIRCTHIAGCLLLATACCRFASLSAAEVPASEAWQALPQYAYGQDLNVLLAIDREVIRSMASPATRAACAARLATLLTAAGTTPAARQYICLQLRQVGTPAQVPILAGLLAQPDSADSARQALEAIPGPESVAALRQALSTLDGQLLVGVINSLGARRDTQCVAALRRLTTSPNSQVMTAAWWAMGNIADRQATACLTEQAKQAGDPLPTWLAVPLLRCGQAQEQAGDPAAAQAIYDMLSRAGQPAGPRRAALTGLLRLLGDRATGAVLAWFTDADPDRRAVATARLNSLPDAQLDQLLDRLADLPEPAQLAVVELAASRRGAAVLPLVMTLVRSTTPAGQLAGIRCLGMVGDVSAIPPLLDRLAAEPAVAAAAQDALLHLPRKEVVAALLDALPARPAQRVPVIGALVKLTCYEAIDPLITLASQPDPAVFGPALDGLRGIADPDKTDIPRLVRLLLTTAPGHHRDEVEKTIVIVTDKLPAGADRSELVRAALIGTADEDAVKYLPLLGRLGGAASQKMIQAGLQSGDTAIREAAIRGLCNWPNAEVADQLLTLATDAGNATHQRWALRAYVRVITLASDRPERRTLGMLQDAFRLASTVEDRQLVLQRTATVRTMDSVTWLAEFLQDPALAQTACGALVELAHHRFLRQPHMEQFGPILDKVGRVSKDPEVVERAKRYRLGL